MNLRKRNWGFARHSQHSVSTHFCDPEHAMQERFSVFAWLVFHVFAVWSALSYWLRFKRICAWHQPKAIRMGGNPFARHVTHGMCPDCFARISGEVISQPSHAPAIRKATSKAAIENKFNLIQRHL